MLTYLILHYNRPYLLDLNIQLIRKFLPKDTFVILVDDGSLKPVVDSIKDKADLFIGGRDHTEDSCCRVLNQAVGWLKKHSLDSNHIIFSEDDFLFWPSPIVLPPEQSKGEDLLDPSVDIDLPKLVKKGNPIRSAITLLRVCEDVHVAQVSRPVKGNVYYAGDSGIKEWKILDHAKMPKYYYTDWPFVMRMAEFLEIPIPESGSISKFEASNCRWFNTKFGRGTNYAAAPERPYYFHTGYPFSLQPIDIQNERRKKAFRDLQRAYALKQKPEELSKVLCEDYIKGSLRFDLQQVERDGLQKVIQDILHTHARRRVGGYENYTDYLDQQRAKVGIIQDKGNDGLDWEVKNFGRNKEYTFELISKKVPPNRINKRVLVLGARWGSDIDYLKKQGYTQITGIDLYDPPPRGDITFCDAHNISSLKSKFEMFVIFDSLEHFLHPSIVVGEIKRNILPKGYVVVVAPNLSSKNAGKKNDAQVELDSLSEMVLLFKDMGFVLRDSEEIKNKFSFDTYLYVFQLKEGLC